MYCTVIAAGCSSSGWIKGGGTSAAAPLWAGSTAIISEYLQKQGKSRMGFANPALYALENEQQTYVPFHDVTKGNNLYYPATSIGNALSQPNSDHDTDAGSPDAFTVSDIY